MSLYELISTMQALKRITDNKPKAMTVEELAGTKSWIETMTANDPRVKLH